MENVCVEICGNMRCIGCILVEYFATDVVPYLVYSGRVKRDRTTQTF